MTTTHDLITASITRAEITRTEIDRIIAAKLTTPTEEKQEKQMNAQEHYAEAERLLVVAEIARGDDDGNHRQLCREAQVHAALAACATEGESLAKYLTLRAAVLEALSGLKRAGITGGDDLARLRALVGEPS